MTPEDADRLREQVASLDNEQLRLLWRWLTLELVRRWREQFGPRK